MLKFDLKLTSYISRCSEWLVFLVSYSEILKHCLLTLNRDLCSLKYFYLKCQQKLV